MTPTAPLVAVFGSSQSLPGDRDYLEGVRCGRLLTEAGFRVATGGYGGLMEAVSRGAAESGGHVTAVTAPALFPNRTGANEYANVETPHPSLPTRLAGLLDESIASISLPGSIGTWTELMVAWNAAFLERLRGAEPNPVIAVGAEWASLVDAVGGRVGSRDLVVVVDDVEQAVSIVVANQTSQ